MVFTIGTGSNAWTIKQCLYFKQRADGFPMCFFVDLKRQGISEYCMFSIMFFNCLLLDTQKYTTERSWVVYAFRILTVSSWRTILYNDWNPLQPPVPPNFYTTIGDHFISNSKIHNRSCIVCYIRADNAQVLCRDDFFMSLNDFGCFESHVSMKQVCSTMEGVSCPYSLRPSSYSTSTVTF